MPFVFTAQAALELRRREDEDARRALAAAASRRTQAERAVTDAEARLAASLGRASEAEASDPGVASRIWHRNWILGERQRLAALRKALGECEAEAARAADAARAARLRREALERLRERALARWTRADARRDQRIIDELAAVRHRRLRTGGRA